MKFTPASRALATMRRAVASSVGPPNIIVPRHSGEIFSPLRPRFRYCMDVLIVRVSMTLDWKLQPPNSHFALDLYARLRMNRLLKRQLPLALPRSRGPPSQGYSAPMPVMSGKRAFLEILRQEGVEVMFGNPGTTEL